MVPLAFSADNIAAAVVLYEWNEKQTSFWIEYPLFMHMKLRHDHVVHKPFHSNVSLIICRQMTVQFTSVVPLWANYNFVLIFLCICLSIYLLLFGISQEVKFSLRIWRETPANILGNPRVKNRGWKPTPLCVPRGENGGVNHCANLTPVTFSWFII